MSVTEEIKSRLDLVGFISQYTTLKGQGRTRVALCPFHAEKTPSFVVFPETQTWRCFGACGEGGDIFTFVMQRENIGFYEALKLLAEKAGVDLPQRRQQEDYSRLYAMMVEATNFYHETLRYKPGRPALDYARARGIEIDTIKRFTLGAAPDAWTALIDHLTPLGYTDQEMIKAGLAVQHESGRIYDRFRNRLMIPITDEHGRVIAFGARAIRAEDNPKYLNSPQTPIFDKGSTLFGLPFARSAFRETGKAVIVEGYLDAITAHQAGFTNVVAQMGTAFTDAQVKLLARHANIVVIALDADKAGIKATMRDIEVAAAGGSRLQITPSGEVRHMVKMPFDVRVAALPEGNDPDDLIKQDRAAWGNLIEQAQPAANYLIDSLVAMLGEKPTLADREKAAQDILPALIAAENDLQRGTNIQTLALRLRLSERTLLEWASKQPSRARIDNPAKADHSGSLQRTILVALLKNDGWISDLRRAFRAAKLEEVFGRSDFTNESYRLIYSAWIAALDQDDMDYHAHLCSNLDEALQEIYQDLMKEKVSPSPDVKVKETQASDIVVSAMILRKHRMVAENKELFALKMVDQFEANANEIAKVSTFLRNVYRI